MKPRTLWLLSLGVLLCTLFSCSKSLTREEAAKAIIQHYDFPYVEVVRVTGAVNARRHLDNNQGYSLHGGIAIGESSDLFRFEDTYGGRKDLTRKGLKYYVPKEACDICFQPIPQSIQYPVFKCVASNIWEFKQVIGITESDDGNTVTVQYVAVATGVNTFDKYTGKTEGMEEVRTATMKRYDDDSWRVEAEKPKHIVKPDEVAFYANKSNR